MQVEIASVVIHEGKMLLGKDERGWRIPGGVVQEFESCVDAAARTFKEATGVGVTAEHILFVNEDIYAVAGRHRVVIYAWATYIEGEISQKMPTFTDIQWVDVRELGNLQNEMTDEVVDSFYKLSLCMKQTKGN